MLRSFSTEMVFRKLPALLVLGSLVVLLTGCQNRGGTQPLNPFAFNQTIPPPATFSSQESYLGQTPGGFVPQPPATTFPGSGFPGSGSGLPTQPSSSPPANIPFSSDTNPNSGTGATVFAAATSEPIAETGWAPIEVTATNQTAFQAMDAKINTASAVGGFQTDNLESLIVGTSHAVTTIVDEAATLPEPQVLLYTGGYSESQEQ